MPHSSVVKTYRYALIFQRSLATPSSIAILMFARPYSLPNAVQIPSRRSVDDRVVIVAATENGWWATAARRCLPVMRAPSHDYYPPSHARALPAVSLEIRSNAPTVPLSTVTPPTTATSSLVQPNFHPALFARPIVGRMVATHADASVGSPLVPNDSVLPNPICPSRSASNRRLTPLYFQQAETTFVLRDGLDLTT